MHEEVVFGADMSDTVNVVSEGETVVLLGEDLSGENLWSVGVLFTDVGLRSVSTTELAWVTVGLVSVGLVLIGMVAGLCDVGVILDIVVKLAGLEGMLQVLLILWGSGVIFADVGTVMAVAKVAVDVMVMVSCVAVILAGVGSGIGLNLLESVVMPDVVVLLSGVLVIIDVVNALGEQAVLLTVLMLAVAVEVVMVVLTMSLVSMLLDGTVGVEISEDKESSSFVTAMYRFSFDMPSGVHSS